LLPKKFGRGKRNRQKEGKENQAKRAAVCNARQEDGDLSTDQGTGLPTGAQESADEQDPRGLHRRKMGQEKFDQSDRHWEEQRTSAPEIRPVHSVKIKGIRGEEM